MPGEDTLRRSWAALAARSPGAHLVSTSTSFAAVFPAWTPLNNAILLGASSSRSASATAAELMTVYSATGLTTWALWVPSPACDLDAADELTSIEGMVRDTTTLVMTIGLMDGWPLSAQVVNTTVEAANNAGDEPIASTRLPPPQGEPGVEGWVLVDERCAVAGAWTYRNGADVGVYAVGTAPKWRRRGHARALMLHILADAYERGARTASLQSTRIGVPLYRGLGFCPAGRYEEWVPALPVPL
jgi:GNAT superfamily N-acetyltransferase